MSSNKRQKSEQAASRPTTRSQTTRPKDGVLVYKQGVEVPKNVTKVIFDASVIEIPNGYEYQGVFSHRTNLKEVVFNDGLQKIGHNAFCGCTSLTVIKLPSTVIMVGLHAFFHCTNLREVAFNEGLQIIEEDAFADCTSLTIIKLPSTVTELGEGAFYECTNLREVVLHGGLQKIRTYAFAGCSSLEYVKFATISKRAKNLIDTGIRGIEDKLTANQYFELRGGELVSGLEAIRATNWKATRTNLDRVLTWVSFYELREATATIELALWKINIEETRAATVEERDACRGEVPGPVKDAIIQYLEVDTSVDGN